jgi:1,4-alpha-glucan branching enzyme
VQELNGFYRLNPALYTLDQDPDGFRWINCIAMEKCMISFMRLSRKVEETLVIVANFANIKQIFDIGVPYEGKYREVFNTDESRFGGNGRINRKVLQTADYEVDDFPFSFPMSAAPLSLVVFAYTPFTEEEREAINKAKEEQIKKRLAEEKAAAEKKAQAEIKSLEQKAPAEKEAAEAREREEKAAAEARVQAEIAAAEQKAAEELKRLAEKQKSSPPPKTANGDKE